MKIQITRGESITCQSVESEHEVLAQVISFDQKIVFSNLTSTKSILFPRSALKMLQVLPLLAIDSQLKGERLACSCGSHLGCEIHTELVKNWLKELNLPEESLACGPQEPIDTLTNRRFVQSHQKPQRSTNTCSGKHTAMLSACQHYGFSTANYNQPHHPLQLEIKKYIEEYTQEKMLHWGWDGCSLPSYAIGFHNFTLAQCRLIKETLNGKSASRIFTAFTQFPDYTSGQGNFCSRLMKANPDKLLVKMGAEGVQVAWELGPKPKAYVIKTLDGNPRATETALCHLMNRFGSQLDIPRDLLYPQLKNWAGQWVGTHVIQW